MSSHQWPQSYDYNIRIVDCGTRSTVGRAVAFNRLSIAEYLGLNTTVIDFYKGKEEV